MHKCITAERFVIANYCLCVHSARCSRPLRESSNILHPTRRAPNYHFTKVKYVQQLVITVNKIKQLAIYQQQRVFAVRGGKVAA